MEWYRVTLTNPTPGHKVRRVHLIICHTPGTRVVNRFGHLGHPMPVCDWHVQYRVEYGDGRHTDLSGRYVVTEADAYSQVADWEAGLVGRQPYLVRSESGPAIGTAAYAE